MAHLINNERVKSYYMKRIVNTVIVVLFLSYMANAQDYIKYFSDPAQKTNDSIARDFGRTVFGNEFDDDCYVTFRLAYLTHGVIMNLLYLDEGMIDTALFSKQYFCSGQFLKDYMKKDSLREESYKHFFSETYMYNKCSGECYSFRLNEWVNRNDADTLFRLKDYTYRCCEFERFMGVLYGKGILDCIFAYPTDLATFDLKSPALSTLFGLFFGIKDNQFYVIYDNWSSENQGNDPRLFTMDEFIDCCWDKMSDVRLKQ